MPVLFGLIEQEQELTPALQRQSREGAERDSWSGLEIFSWKKTFLKSTFLYILEVNLVYRKIQTK